MLPVKNRVILCIVQLFCNFVTHWESFPMTNSSDTRNRLKQRARALCQADNRAMLFITLCFLLISDWLTVLLRLVKENPLILITNDLSDHLLSMIENTTDLTSLDPTPAYLSALATGREIFTQTGTRQLVFAYVLLFFCTIIFHYGYYHCCLKRVRGTKVQVQELVSCYEIPIKVLVLELLVTLCVSIGFTFFFFPGIYLYYRYSMACFCLVDHPGESVFHAMHRSAQLTRGRKMELFQCDLSFIGWILLSMLAGELCGNLGALISSTVANIAYLLGVTLVNCYVMPYRQMTLAGYYNSFLSRQSNP